MLVDPSAFTSHGDVCALRPLTTISRNANPIAPILLGFRLQSWRGRDCRRKPNRMGAMGFAFLLIVVRGLSAQTSPCDVNADGSTNIIDVQLAVNQASGASPCTRDLDRDGKCNVIDVQRIIAAALGGSCN